MSAHNADMKSRHHRLLYDLKREIERNSISLSPVSVRNVLLNVFDDGIKQRSTPGSPFVRAVSEAYERFFGRRCSHPFSDASDWLSTCLNERCLFGQLTLLNKPDKLEQLYSEDAFLRNPLYADSLMCCAKAIDERKAEHLSEIDPALFLAGAPSGLRTRSVELIHSALSMRTGGGSSSCTSALLLQSTNAPLTSHQCPSSTLSCRKCIELLVCDLIDKTCRQPTADDTRTAKLTHRRVKSDMQANVVASKLPGCVLTAAAPTVFNNRICRSATPPPLMPIEYDVVSDQRYWESARKTLVDARIRDMEISMELERENAHLYLSEMLIAAVEQMKWRGQMMSMGEGRHKAGGVPSYRTSTPRFDSTTGGIPIPQLPRTVTEGAAAMSLPYSYSSEQSGPLELTIADSSDGAASSSVYPPSEFSLGDDTAETSGGLCSPTPSASRRTSDEFQQPSSLEGATYHREFEADESSAELVAASLLRHFSKTHMPHSGELDWLVSYKDAPQLLLPLPTSYPVAPDQVYTMADKDGSSRKLLLRGTFEWAPPRPMWIFSLQQRLSLKEALKMQSFRCAGCGQRLDKSVYLKRVRYCEYYGKFFCLCCHRGAKSTVPARVLLRWDFRTYPVCDVAQKFLYNHVASPVINVPAVNGKLYEKVSAMRIANQLRAQLFHMWNYVKSCRDAETVMVKEIRLLDLFIVVPGHFLLDIDLYSMTDLECVKINRLAPLIEPALKHGRAHIERCQLCVARAFLCELCSDVTPLFPFDLSRVTRCIECGACYHRKCLTRIAGVCPRCVRISSRRTTTFLEESEGLQ